MEQAPTPLLLKFGPYLVDLAAGEVRKNGYRIRLQENPLRVLALLAEKQGQLVTREELRKRLWPGDTFVDFETGLNAAVSKLRDALSDSAEKSRYIETIPRRGYRFLPPVEIVASNGHAAPSSSIPSQDHRTLESLAAAGHQLDQLRASSAAWIRATIAAAAVLLLFTIWWLTPLPDPRVTDIFPVTQTGRQDFLVRPATDGIRIFYVQRSGDHYDLMQSSANGGDAQKIDAPFPNTLVWDVSPDGSKYLITSFHHRGEPAPLWTWPAIGGSPVKIGDIVSGSATFSPDGRQIVYHLDHDIFIANVDGSGIRRLINLGEDQPDSTIWSPDGKTLRFGRGDHEGRSALWEIGADGANPHPVLPNWQEMPEQWGGSWTPDGRYFLFVDGVNPSTRLYAIREKGEWWRRSPRGPFLLASEAAGSWSPLVSRDGHQVYFYGASLQSDFETLDLSTQQFSAFLHEKRPVMLSFSRDSQWITYIHILSGVLWTSHVDGRAPSQISLTGLRGAFPRLSPDNQTIAFTGLKIGAPQNVYLVPAAGGTPRPVIAGSSGMGDPDWAPDGSRLVVDRDLHPAKPQQPDSMLSFVDLKTSQITDAPGSQDLHMPRWSPDGRYIAAVRGSRAELLLFDTTSQTWTTIAQGKSLSFPVWSATGSDIFFQDVLASGEPLYRINIATRSRTLVTSFQKILDTGITRCAFVALTPDGSPIVTFDRSNSDIYGARLSLP